MKRIKRIIYFLIILTGGIGLAGCNISSSVFNIHDKLETVAGSKILLSGSLSIPGSTTGKNIITSKDIHSRAVDYTAYKLYCVTFEESPSSASGDALSSGAFSLDFPGARNTAFGCFIYNTNGTATTTDDTMVATMVFENASQSGMSGGSQQQGQITLTGSANLGTITIDLEKGTATVDITNVKLQDSNDTAVVDTSSLSSDTLFDFTGTWILGPYKNNLQSDMPPGYSIMLPCSTSTNGGGGGGPCLTDGKGGMSIFLRRIMGHEWIYSGSEQGTSTDYILGHNGNMVYGIMVWQSIEAFETCGSAIGVSIDDAKKYGHINFTGYVDGTTGINSVVPAYYTISSSTNFNWTNGIVTYGNSTGSTTKTILDGWRVASATSSNDMWGQIIAGEVFQDLNRNGYQDGFEPFANGYIIAKDLYGNVINRGQWDQYSGYLLSGYNPLFASNTTWDGGIWGMLATSTMNCSAIATPTSTEPYKIAQAQCYANAFWNLPSDDSKLCLKDMRFNWRSNTYNDYVNANSGPPKPRTMMVLEKFIYTSPKSGSFTQVEQREESIQFQDITAQQNNNHRSLSCQILNTMEFNLTFVDSNTMIGDMKQTSVLLDRDPRSDPLCSATTTPAYYVEQNNSSSTISNFHLYVLDKLRIGVQRNMFTFIK